MLNFGLVVVSFAARAVIRVNVGMTLPEFKFIYWMEWSHRMAARAAGVIFGLPFLYFLVSGRIRGKLLGRLSALFALGGVQVRVNLPQAQ
jgi:cytochrome c oxidase assembly protein subunit 15